MPIQRFYNLPSCTLQIEGISAEGGDRLSILTGFECKFHHNGTIIAGDRDLLENLIKSAGKYAQTLHDEPVGIYNQSVSLEPVEMYLHKLKIKSSENIQDRSQANSELADSEVIEVQLDTVQLFDLVESIDRLCLDPQNSLNFSVVIEPVVSSPKVSASVLPAIIGVSSLAIASAILFLIPTPKPDPKPQPQPVSLILPHLTNSKDKF
jgi:hypothetical protein